MHIVICIIQSIKESKISLVLSALNMSCSSKHSQMDFSLALQSLTESKPADFASPLKVLGKKLVSSPKFFQLSV